MTAHLRDGGTSSTTLPPVDEDTRIPGELGLWLFIALDVVAYTVYFATFMYTRGQRFEMFAEGQRSLNQTLGAVNTVVLLTSSLLVVTGLAHITGGRQSAGARYILGAVGCGAVFTILKSFEWASHFADGVSVDTNDFYVYYFMMTGVHLLHVLIGMFVLTRVALKARKFAFTDHDHTVAENSGLFWHMVDLLWIVLFSLFYLVQ